MSKKRDFGNPEVINWLNQSPNNTVFSIVQFPGGAKTVLSGDSLFMNGPVHCSAINILRSVAKIIIEVCETNNKESKSL